MCLFNIGRYKEAETIARQTIEVGEIILQQSPSVSDGHHNMSVSLWLLGNVIFKRAYLNEIEWPKGMEEVEQLNERALSCEEKLVSEYPENLKYKIQLAKLLYNGGQFFYYTGKITEAESVLNRGIAIAEQQLLCADRAARIDKEANPVCRPAPEALHRVVVHVAGKISLLVAALPEMALQRLQRCRLSVLRNPGEQYCYDTLDRRAGFAGFHASVFEQGGDRRSRRIGFDECWQLAGGIGKEHVLHERERGRGALDVGEYRLDHCRLLT